MITTSTTMGDTLRQHALHHGRAGVTTNHRNNHTYALRTISDLHSMLVDTNPHTTHARLAMGGAGTASAADGRVRASGAHRHAGQHMPPSYQHGRRFPPVVAGRQGQWSASPRPGAVSAPGAGAEPWCPSQTVVSTENILLKSTRAANQVGWQVCWRDTAHGVGLLPPPAPAPAGGAGARTRREGEGEGKHGHGCAAKTRAVLAPAAARPCVAPWRSRGAVSHAPDCRFIPHSDAGNATVGWRGGAGS